MSRKIKPVGIIFSGYYFYLTAFIEEIDKEKAYKNPNDLFPTIYRVDRLQEFEVVEAHFAVPYAERFEEGEFLNYPANRELRKEGMDEVNKLFKETFIRHKEWFAKNDVLKENYEFICLVLRYLENLRNGPVIKKSY